MPTYTSHESSGNSFRKISENNHYVPQWYQKQFIHKKEQQIILHDNHHLGKFVRRSTKKCFVEKNLYATFGDGLINDEIEAKLFGLIDKKGADAIKALMRGEKEEVLKNFEHLFKYVGIQKIRTLKGLDWLKSYFRKSDENQLMFLMQSVQTLFNTILMCSVREIVCARDSDIKFIFSDHPVTLYNHALSPDSIECTYPNDPSINQTASQTIFPLNGDLCLIFTNLEYALNQNVNPLQDCRNGKYYKESMANAEYWPEERLLSSSEVNLINKLIFARCKRYVAGGAAKWINTDRISKVEWQTLGKILYPPKNISEEFEFDLTVGFTNGTTARYDAFGRKNPETETIGKNNDNKNLGDNNECRCNLGTSGDICCCDKIVEICSKLKGSSIQERNLGLLECMCMIFGLDENTNLKSVQTISAEQVYNTYRSFSRLWPYDTDIFKLLPRSNGKSRALLVGNICSDTILDLISATSVLFDEVYVQNPLMYPNHIINRWDSILNQEQFRNDFCSDYNLLIQLSPLIYSGRVVLFPNPLHFERQLGYHFEKDARDRNQVVNKNFELVFRLLSIAQQLHGIECWQNKEEYLRGMSRDYLFGTVEGNNRVSSERKMFGKVQPNLDMALFISQVIGATIVTNDMFRWLEINATATYFDDGYYGTVPNVAKKLNTVTLPSFENFYDVYKLDQRLSKPPLVSFFSNLASHLQGHYDNKYSSSSDSDLVKDLETAFSEQERFMTEYSDNLKRQRVQIVSPNCGIQSNTVNLRLLQSGVNDFLRSVPLALLVT